MISGSLESVEEVKLLKLIVVNYAKAFMLWFSCACNV